jgi:hypothetical protein
MTPEILALVPLEGLPNDWALRLGMLGIQALLGIVAAGLVGGVGYMLTHRRRGTVRQRTWR